jgi:hypothetical protein
VAKSNTGKPNTVLKTAKDKSESSRLGELVQRGHALIRKSEGKEEIVATCLNKSDAAAIYAVVRAFYMECMDDEDDSDGIAAKEDDVVEKDESPSVIPEEPAGEILL